MKNLNPREIKLIKTKSKKLNPIGFNFLLFVLISLISRGLRFFIVSYLSYKFGDLFNEYMDKHGSKWFTIIGILIVIIGLIIYLIFKSHV